MENISANIRAVLSLALAATFAGCVSQPHSGAGVKTTIDIPPKDQPPITAPKPQLGVIERMHYDSTDSKGTILVRFDPPCDQVSARDWAIKNVEKLVRSKNIALKTGEEPPDGRRYTTQSEMWSANTLEIEFKAE